MDNPDVINLILCGGVGSRLWPLSRKLLPKQFSRILQGHSLFERTVTRNRALSSRVMIAANRHQAFLAFNQMENLGMMEHSGLIEPVGRNTAPAIALAAMLCPRDSILLVSPSDHLIADEDAYANAVQTAVSLADTGRIVTFGIRPGYAETGFGYIEADQRASDAYAVRGFREKPDAATARAYVEAGNYYWNSGMFCFRADAFLAELELHAPEVFRACQGVFEKSNGSKAKAEGGSWQPALQDMESIPAISVDYAVMEKSDKMAVVPCSIGWSDLGSLDALYDYYAAHQQGPNALAADTEPLCIDSKANLVVGGRRQVALIDVENLLVVETPDALLISKRGSSQKVKQVVTQLEQRPGPESRLVERFPSVERPWGNYTTLHADRNYLVRKIEMKPGCRSSLQRHRKREEFWTVVSGKALVQIAESAKLYGPGQGVEVPLGAVHRLSNVGDEPLVIIETQLACSPVQLPGTQDGASGSVQGKIPEPPEIDETDVERIEDDYRWLS